MPTTEESRMLRNRSIEFKHSWGKKSDAKWLLKRGKSVVDVAMYLGIPVSSVQAFKEMLEKEEKGKSCRT